MDRILKAMGRPELRGGHEPADGPMPREYCLCCGGHVVFHYQKALGLKLKVVEVENSAFIDPFRPWSATSGRPAFRFRVGQGRAGPRGIVRF